MAATAPFKKVVQSAVIIMPPQEVWGPIQEIRKVHDKSYVRWMPHINLLYPFVESSHFADVIDNVKSAVKTLKPFPVRFQQFQYFTHKGSCTMWLQPDVANKEVHELQHHLELAFPYCDDLSQLSDHGYSPHLSVGQWPKNEINAAVKKFQTGWAPIDFTVNEIFVIGRSNFDDPFHIHYRVPFGDQPVEKLYDESTAAVNNNQSVQKAPSNCKAFIGNLAFSTSDQEVLNFASQNGINPKAVKILKGPGGRSKGFGFLEFDTPEEAQNAIQELNGKDLNGRNVQVQPAK